MTIKSEMDLALRPPMPGEVPLSSSEVEYGVKHGLIGIRYMTTSIRVVAGQTTITRIDRKYETPRT
jgi:hypothetical protein